MQPSRAPRLAGHSKQIILCIVSIHIMSACLELTRNSQIVTAVHGYCLSIALYNNQVLQNSANVEPVWKVKRRTRATAHLLVHQALWEQLLRLQSCEDDHGMSKLSKWSWTPLLLCQ